MKRTGNSLGKECAAFGCSGRSYCFVNKDRKPTGILFFKFPKSKAEINNWCNLIKRQNGKEKKRKFNIYMLETFSCSIYLQSPWWYTKLPNKEKSPKITFMEYFWRRLGKSRKPLSYRTSPRKKIHLDLDVSSNRKDNIFDFSVQAGQEEVSQNCNKNTVDSLNTSAVPTTFAFVTDDLHLEKEKEDRKKNFLT